MRPRESASVGGTDRDCGRTPIRARVRLEMRGRIDVGVPLAFSATQELTADGFTRSARAGLGPVRPLRVTDTLRDGAGAADGRLGPLRFLHAEGAVTALTSR